jgi:hypothetical protein
VKFPDTEAYNAKVFPSVELRIKNRSSSVELSRQFKPIVRQSVGTAVKFDGGFGSALGVFVGDGDGVGDGVGDGGDVGLGVGVAVGVAVGAGVGVGLAPLTRG